MLQLEDRVDRLEEMMIKTQMVIQSLSIEMKKFKDEMSEFKNEMSEFKNEMSEFKNEMSEFKNEMSEFKNETRQDSKKRNKEWADLARKMGTIVEDIVVPNMEWIGEKYFNLKDYMDFIVRSKRKKPDDISKEKEFDVIIVYKDKILLNETKSTPRMDSVKDFISFIKNKEFYEYYPEHKNKELIPIFASIYIPEHILKHLSKNNIFAMGMKEETMDLLNPECLKKG